MNKINLRVKKRKTGIENPTLGKKRKKKKATKKPSKTILSMNVKESILVSNSI